MPSFSADNCDTLNLDQRPGTARPLTVISALAGKHSLKISLRIATKRSPLRASVMKTVIVTMSFRLPPWAFNVWSMDAKTSRTCASKSATGDSDAV